MLQFLAAAYEPLGAGGALWKVVGCVRGKGGLWFGGLKDRLGDGQIPARSCIRDGYILRAAHLYS
jgi:hypothetical protein